MVDLGFFAEAGLVAVFLLGATLADVALEAGEGDAAPGIADFLSGAFLPGVFLTGAGLAEAGAVIANFASAPRVRGLT